MKSIYPAGWRSRPPPACRKSFRLLTFECKKEIIIVEKAVIETFVITEDNRTQTALQTVWCSVNCYCGLCMDSFRLMEYECIKGGTIRGKADIDTFVITEANRAQTAN